MLQRAQIVDQTLLWVLLWGCFWMRLTYRLVDRVKHICLPNVGGPHPISWRPEQNKGADPPSSKREFLLPDCLWTGILDFLLLELNWNICSSWVSSLQAFRLELHYQFWVSGLQTQTGTTPLALLGFQLSDSSCRSWGLSASTAAWANSL